MAERRITISLPDALVGEVELAVGRGETSTPDEFIANAIQHELRRLRDAATTNAAPQFSMADEGPPEDVGIGWGGLMPNVDESRKESFSVKPEDAPDPD